MARRLSPILAVLVGALLLGLPTGPAAAQPKPAVKCLTGPAPKTFGGQKWLVYSCDDDRTVVVIASPESPAAPYYFVLASDGVGYKVTGEGTGPKSATESTLKTLKLLTEAEIRGLIQDTKVRH